MDKELLRLLHRAYKGLTGSHKQGVSFLMADIERALQAHGINPRSPSDGAVNNDAIYTFGTSDPVPPCDLCGAGGSCEHFGG